MPREFPSYLSIDYSAGEGESPADYPSMPSKIEKAISVTKQGLEEYRKPVVMWTGGKDSTLTLYFVLEVADKYGYDVPDAVFIDHFQHFDSVFEFVEHWADRWGITVKFARNTNIAELAEEPGDEIRVEDLNDENFTEVREKLGYEEETFPFLLDTYVGNHLLKTVALNNIISDLGVDGVFSGVRWDEQEARADETFFSARHNAEKYPPHDRIHPILQFTESDVWEVTWKYVVPDSVKEYPAGHIPKGFDDLPSGIDQSDIPVSPKYFEGYRSLGSEASTTKTESVPAWEQNLDDTEERAGRAQDKEELMERLRELGYM